MEVYLYDRASRQFLAVSGFRRLTLDNTYVHTQPTISPPCSIEEPPRQATKAET